VAGSRRSRESASGALDLGYGEARLEADIGFDVLSALFVGEDAEAAARQRAAGFRYSGDTQKAALRGEAIQSLVGGVGKGAGIAAQGGLFSPQDDTTGTKGVAPGSARTDQVSRMAALYGEGGFNPNSPGQYYRGYSGGNYR
jgi:hypothetical protein